MNFRVTHPTTLRILILVTLVSFTGCSERSAQPVDDSPAGGLVHNDEASQISQEQEASSQKSESTSSNNQPSADAVANLNASQSEGSKSAPEPELPSLSDTQSATTSSAEPDDEVLEEDVPEVHTIDIPDSWKRLSDKHEIWVDFENKTVIAGGYICMTTGSLEVFACPRRTKEHESVVSVHAMASQIHAALLALGASPGKPVQWPFEENEKYIPASGPVVNIDVIWRDKEEVVQTRRAQEMVYNIRTEKPMEIDWVFGGSQTFTDEESGETYYYGDSGELVCLSNFATATMDVPVESSDANEGLLFEANTKAIPPLETKVYLKFKPELE